MAQEEVFQLIYHVIGNEGELTPDAKDSCLGHGKLFQTFSEADQALFVVFGPSSFSGRLFQNP